MKLVSAALAVGAALALAIPASAQTRTLNANNFRVSIDGVGQKFVRTVDFEAVQTAGVTSARTGAQITPGLVQLKLNASRAESYLDDWLADAKSPTRKVRVELLEPNGKPAVAYDFADCWIAKSVWSLDASSNSIATATWTLSCAAVIRGAP